MIMSEETTKSTYEDTITEARKNGVRTHEIRIRSTKFGDQTIRLQDVEETYRMWPLLVAAARRLHGEEVDEDGFLYETISEEDMRMGTDHWWSLEVFDLFPPHPTDEYAINPKSEWLYGHRMGAYRMANPKSKVFISTGGRDCDGYTWSRMDEYKTLSEADEGVDEAYRGSDGGMGWSCITQEQYETSRGM